MFSAPVTLREQPRAAEMTLQDVPLSRVFKRLFSDGSTFLPKYHAARSEDNFTPSLWTRPEGKMSCGVRYASCVVPTPMGRKQLYEACRYWWVADTVAVQCSSQVPDITFGSNFRTETFYEFRKKSDGSVAVSLFSNINFLKSPGFLGSTIKKAATKACDEAAQGFTAAARKALIKRSKAAGDSSEPDEEDEPATSTTSPDRRYASLMDGLTYVLSVCVAVALLLFFALVFSSPGALLSAPEAGNRDLIARRAEEFAAAYPSLAVAPVELAVPHLRSEVVLYHLLDQQLQHLQLLQRLAGTSFVFIGTIFALRRLNHN
ncbi:Protein VASCULAR ASSOCIATED DEATH 1 [Diplonema papillatum]|nr:Protein VASCULAR ASSOCIATED DEATH 1 [Diplonema papillatum]